MTLFAELSTRSIVKLGIAAVLVIAAVVVNWIAKRAERQARTLWIEFVNEVFENQSPEEAAAEYPEEMQLITEYFAELKADEQTLLLAKLSPTRCRQLKEYFARHRPTTKDEVV